MGNTLGVRSAGTWFSLNACDEIPRCSTHRGRIAKARHQLPRPLELHLRLLAVGFLQLSAAQQVEFLVVPPGRSRLTGRLPLG
jgi:hypothetical protein